MLLSSKNKFSYVNSSQSHGIYESWLLINHDKTVYIKRNFISNNNKLVASISVLRLFLSSNKGCKMVLFPLSLDKSFFNDFSLGTVMNE